MKYIKTYEKNNTTERLYKDYIVTISLNNNNIPLFILSTDQIRNNEKDNLFYYKSYSYYKANKTELTTDYHHSSIKKDRLIIQYQSDDLQECIDIIPTLLSQNKFNI